MYAEVHHSEIDTTHAEMAELVAALNSATDADYPALFATLIEHTERHFEGEEEMMRESGFIHAAEHITEHRQMLQEMRQFQQRRLPISRAYVRERIPERFNLHIVRMDSLLAAWQRSN